MPSNGEKEGTNVPLLQDSASTNVPLLQDSASTAPSPDDSAGTLTRRFWIESKKLWHIVGPTIFSRMASYSMFVITQAFAGHLGDLELAAISIANTVVVAFNFGLLLGMASALETLCGQAFGGKKYYMLGVYMQRSWIVLFICCVLLLPLYVFASPVLKLLGQPDDVAELSGVVSLWLLPVHFSFAFQFPLQRFLQSQLKTMVIAWVSLASLLVHLLVTWLFVYKMQLGLIGTAITLSFSWWVLIFGMFGYVACGGCPRTWTGFSMEAFSDLWEFVKLSVASGVMLWVRVSNELGAGNGKGARFATIVSVVTSIAIGVFFFILILIFHNELALIFSSSEAILQVVSKMSILLAFTILLNSVQPVLSGVAVGSGWQSIVAYINLGCYYLIGVPLGILLGWVFHQGVMGIWAGMIFGGTAVQTLILAIITMRCDWDREKNYSFKIYSFSKSILRWHNFVKRDFKKFIKN
ncbi:protein DETOXIFICATION 27 [Citrus sinensis]|nr:protein DETOXIFICATION 27 [Citrus sinensis]